MKTKTALIASCIIAVSAFATPAMAQEKTVQQLLNGMIKQAIDAASDEIEVQIEKAITNTGNILSVGDEKPQGRVIVTDIARSLDEKASDIKELVIEG